MSARDDELRARALSMLADSDAYFERIETAPVAPVDAASLKANREAFMREEVRNETLRVLLGKDSREDELTESAETIGRRIAKEAVARVRAEVESICSERDWDSPLVASSYCAKPPNHEGGHDFRYDAHE